MLTPTVARELLALYQQMYAAAESGDWDSLADFEREAAAVRRTAEKNSQPVALSPDDAAMLQQLITEILDLDRAIRLHAEPALESTRKLLSGSVKGRAMRNAYGG